MFRVEFRVRDRVSVRVRVRLGVRASLSIRVKKKLVITPSLGCRQNHLCVIYMSATTPRCFGCSSDIFQQSFES